MPELKHAVAITKALLPELKHHRYAATMAHLQRMPRSYGIHCNHKVFIFDCTPLCVYMNGYVYIFSFSWIHAFFVTVIICPHHFIFYISPAFMFAYVYALCTCTFLSVFHLSFLSLSLSLSLSVSIFMNTCPYMAVIVSVAPSIPSWRQSHSWVVRPV